MAMQNKYRRRKSRPLIGAMISLLVYGAGLLASPLFAATPSVAEIEQEIREFQQFFFSRFPGVSLVQYQDGVNALPQYAQRRLNWELQIEFPPFESELETGTRSWKQPLPSGSSLEECFTGKPPPNAYPYHFDGVTHTIVGDINRCLEFNGAEPLDGMDTEMARLVAAFKAPWNGLQMDIDYRDPAMRDWYQKGRQFFWAKRGQMNLSCANCHVHNAGNQLRGDVLSAALGHTTGFPVYSTERALQGKPLSTIHSRYASCNVLVGAAPFAAQSDEYIALEIYQAILNAGIPLKAPSLRQ